MVLGPIRRRPRLWIAHATLLALTVALGGPTGCAGSRRERELRGAEQRIHKIEFVGVTRFSDKELLAYLDIGESSVFAIGPQFYFNEARLPAQKERIVEVYRAHGFHDVHVRDIRVKTDEKRRRVHLTIIVDEGLPTLVTEVRYQWPDGPPAGPEDKQATPSAIEATSGFSVKDRFEEPALDSAAAAMREALRARGYAFATVEPHAEVNRARKTARVSFDLRPGPFVRIGRIFIDGLEGVPEYLVRYEIDDHPGEPFSPARLEQIERSIYALDVFRLVSASAEAEPNPEGTVDVRVRVRERKPQSVKLGLGLGVEANRWEQRGSALYTHRNLFGHLTRFETRAMAGYAELPAPWNAFAHGPIVRLEPTLRKKALLERRLVWTLAPAYELGIQEGYQFNALKNRVGVSRFFTRYLELGVSHNVRFVDFFNVDNALFRPEDSILGLDFVDPYVVSYLEFAASVYLTDRLLQPQNGVVLSTIYDLAGNYLGGDFDFHRITPSLRGYWRAHERVQLAARAEVGFIIPRGQQPGAPIDMRYYLGGTNSVRGWGVRRLSPRILSCDPASAECRTIPVGGYTMITGNLELRVRVGGPVWMVAFADMGDVQGEQAKFVPTEWNYSTGPGLRVETPIGTLRLDFGVRINETPASEGERRWAIHFGLGEAF